MPSAPAVERQQLAEGVVVGNVGGPTVRARDGGIEPRVRVREPLRAGVVEVRQRTFLERLRGVLVAGNWTLRIAWDWLVHPLDPLGWIEPAVTQLDEPPHGPGDGGSARVVRIVGGGNAGRETVREGESLEGRGRRVARTIFQARTEPERPRLMKPAVQDAEGRVVVTGDDDQLGVGTDTRVVPAE